jgi:hypothetical protein
VLELVIPRLPEALLPEALTIARAIENPDNQAVVLGLLVPRLPEASLPEALVMALAIEDSYERARVLLFLVPRLPETLLPEALAMALAIEDSYKRAQVLELVRPRLPEALLPEVLAMVRTIENPDGRAEILRLIIADFSQFFPKETYLETLLAASTIDTEALRHDLFQQILSESKMVNVEFRNNLWVDLLQRLAVRVRSELLSDLSDIMPLIARSGDATAVSETFRAIQDVTNWWP